jgi:hypothetical protein
VVTDEAATPPLDAGTRAALMATLRPLPRLVLSQMSADEGRATSRLARIVCQPEWTVQSVVEDLHRVGLIERGTGGWRLSTAVEEAADEAAVQAAQVEDMLVRIRLLAADEESPAHRVGGAIADVLREQVTEDRRARIRQIETSIDDQLDALGRYLAEASLIVWPRDRGAPTDQKLYGLIHNSIGRAAALSNARHYLAEAIGPGGVAGTSPEPAPGSASAILARVRDVLQGRHGRYEPTLAEVRAVLAEPRAVNPDGVGTAQVAGEPSAGSVAGAVTGKTTEEMEQRA